MNESRCFECLAFELSLDFTPSVLLDVHWKDVCVLVASVHDIGKDTRTYRDCYEGFHYGFTVTVLALRLKITED